MAEGGTALLHNEHPALRRAWHPLALSREVGTEPARFWLLGQPWVAVRLDGALTVLADRCPHRLAPLSAGSVVDGQLQCAYHGWCFGPDGRATVIPSIAEGAVLPPKARAQAPFSVIERSGMIFIAPEEPVNALPDDNLPFAVEGPTEVVHLGPYQGPYSAALLIDNQIDVSHFAFLHRGTFGTGEAARLAPYEVCRAPWGFSVDMSVPVRAANDPGVAANIRPLAQHRHMRYRYHAPFHLTLTLTYPVMGGHNHIVFWAQPQKFDLCRLYVTMYLHQPGGFGRQELADRVKFEERVVDEDLRLQACYQELGLPLSLPEECHVKADAASLEYRRLLRQLVATAGEGPAHSRSAQKGSHPAVARLSTVPVQPPPVRPRHG